MNPTKLLSDLQMLCSCIYDITNKPQIKIVGRRLEDIIGEHFGYSKSVTICSGSITTMTVTPFPSMIHIQEQEDVKWEEVKSITIKQP